MSNLAVLLLVFLTFLTAGQAQAFAGAKLSSNQTRIALSSSAEFMADVSGSLGIEDITHPQNQARFVPVKSDALSC